MNTKNTYAVFGLGRYGMAVTKELLKNGADVMGVDIDEETVCDAAMEIPVCKCADVTDINVLKQLDIANIDIVIIAMASNLEASVLAVTLCKEIGVKTVIAKCANEMHQKILSRVGADRVVFPEKESGTRLAKNLLSSNIVDMIELSDNVAILNIDIPKSWAGKTLSELNPRKKYGINILGIRKKSDIIIDINPEMPLEDDVGLIIIADAKKVNKLMQIIQK